MGGGRGGGGHACSVAAVLLLCVVARHTTSAYRDKDPQQREQEAALHARRVEMLQARAANDARHRPVFESSPDTTREEKIQAAQQFLQTRASQMRQSRKDYYLNQTVSDPTDFLEVKKLRMLNGATLLHRKDQSAPLVSIVFSYHVGSRHETSRTQGVAHLLEHMLFKGTPKRPLQWGRLFYVLGDATNAMTTYGHTTYFHTVHKSALEPILELELDRMKNVSLAEDSFEKEKWVVMSELTGGRGEALMRLNEQVMAAAYGDSWPGRSIGGKTVMDLTRDDAFEFYRAGYRPGCLTITVVGDIEWEELLEKMHRSGLMDAGAFNAAETARCAFNIPRPVPITLRPDYNHITRTDHKVIMKEADADVAFLEYLVPVANLTDTRDVAALMVLESMLNGGLLASALADLGVPADGGVMTNFEEDAGWMLVLVGVGGGQFNDVLRVDNALSGKGGLFERLGKAGAGNPVNALSVGVAVGSVVDATRREWFSGPDSIALHLGTDQTLTGDYLFTQRLLNKTKSVRVADVVGAAAKYLRRERIVVGTLSRGTEQEAQETQARFGDVEKFTEHESINNTREYFESIQCHIPTADDVLRYVAELRYEGEHTMELAGGETRGKSIPIAPPLCFQEPRDCKVAGSFQPPRPMYVRLANGMEIIAQRDRGLDDTDAVSLFGFVDAGMEYDPLDYEGTSMMAALTMQLNVFMHQMTSRPANSSAPPPVGNVVVAPQLEGMLIHGQAQCHGLDSTLEALHFALTNSQMMSAGEHQQLQRMLGDMVEEMASSPSFAIRQVLLGEIFPQDHPQVRAMTRESIDRIPVELVRKFYINRVCPETVKLAVVSGQFSMEPLDLVNKIGLMFESWPACRDRPPPRSNNGTVREFANGFRPPTIPTVPGVPTVSGAARAPTAGPLAKLGELFKLVSGETDAQIRASEEGLIGQVRDMETAIRGQVDAGSRLVANAFNRVVASSERMQQPATGPSRTEIEEAHEAELPATLARVPLLSAPLDVEQELGFLGMLETEQIDQAAPPQPSASSQAPQAPPALQPQLPQQEQPAGVQGPQRSRSSAFHDSVQATLDKQQELKRFVGSAGSAFLSSFFNPRPGTNNLGAMMNKINSESSPSSKTATGLFPSGIDGGRFGFLSRLSEFREKLATAAAPAPAQAQSDASTAISELLAQQGQSKGSRLLRAMQSLRSHSHQSHDPPVVADSGIPGILSSQPRISSVDDLGSVLAVSWLDIASLLGTGKAGSARANNAQGAEGTVLGNALRAMFDSINERVLEKKSRALSRATGAGKAVSAAGGLQGLWSQVPAPEKVGKALYRKAEAELNQVRAQLDAVAQRLPASVAINFEKLVAHPPHAPSLHGLNNRLSMEIKALEKKLPLGGKAAADLSEAKRMYMSIQPDLASIATAPFRAMLEDGDGNPDEGEGEGGGLKDEDGGIASAEDARRQSDAEGTNSQPEPTYGGLLGLVPLPDIPRQPYYPPALDRPGVVWIQKKVPGLHEAITIMLSDTLVHKDPLLAPAMVANHVLGGNSLSGKLGYWVRDCKGLTYHIASHFDVSRHSGLFLVQMQTQVGAALEQAVNDTLNIMQQLKENGLTPGELNAAKRNLISMANIEASDARHVTQRILMDLVYAQTGTQGSTSSGGGGEDAARLGDENLWTSATQRVLDLEVPDVKRATRAVFHPDKMVILSLGGDLEDGYFPNRELDEDYLTPEPGRDCPDPEGDDGSPFKGTDPERYLPPSHSLFARHPPGTQSSAEQQAHHQQLLHLNDPNRLDAPADLLVRVRRDRHTAEATTMAARQQEELQEEGEGAVVRGVRQLMPEHPKAVQPVDEVARLRDNVLQLGALGARYADSMTGGNFATASKLSEIVRRKLEASRQQAADQAGAPGTTSGLFRQVQQAVGAQQAGL